MKNSHFHKKKLKHHLCKLVSFVMRQPWFKKQFVNISDSVNEFFLKKACYAFFSLVMNHHNSDFKLNA
jgi:hypothetical protein